MRQRLHVLIVEDSEQDAAMVIRTLECGGYEVVHQRVQTAAGMKAALERARFDAVLADYSMPTFTAPAALDVLRASGQDLPFIIVSETIGEETAVAALKAGAHDFVIKGRLARLLPALEREIREAAVRRERERMAARYRSLVEDAVFGIYQATPEGDFLAVNPALVRMLGYASADELVAAGLSRVFADTAVLVEFGDQALHQQEFHDEEARWLRKQGDAIQVRLSGRVIADEVTGLPIYEVIVEDVTERHRLEGQLQQAQRMEAVGRLAGGIAHDSNNILTALIGFSGMILEQIGADKPISEDLMEIHKAANDLAALNRQLLAFIGRQPLQMIELDINDVVRNTQKMLRRLISEDIDMRLTLGSDVPLITADRAQLEQVLVNLIVNARDAMPRGGQLFIETSRVDAGELAATNRLRVPPGTHVKLTVRDTGSGMDADTLEHLFEPFFTTKSPGKGTGLGLATVYGIVKQLGGHIDVASEPGRGTTFTMVFAETPIDESVSAPASAAWMPRLAEAHEVVLLVEDETSVRHLVSRVLERHGYAVLEAANAEEALALAARYKGSIDLVVSDVVMPVIDGPEMIERLIRTRPEVKVLYISGYAADTTRRGLQDTGARFLAKPFTAHDLLNAVGEMLSVAVK